VNQGAADSQATTILFRMVRVSSYRSIAKIVNRSRKRLVVPARGRRVRPAALSVTSFPMLPVSRFASVVPHRFSPVTQPFVFCGNTNTFTTGICHHGVRRHCVLWAGLAWSRHRFHLQRHFRPRCCEHDRRVTARMNGVFFFLVFVEYDAAAQGMWHATHITAKVYIGHGAPVTCRGCSMIHCVEGLCAINACWASAWGGFFFSHLLRAHERHFGR